MHTPRPHPWLAPTALFAGALLFAPGAKAAPEAESSEAHVAEIEIVDVQKDKSRETTRFTFTVTEKDRGAAVSMPVGALGYDVNARCDGTHGSLLGLQVSVHRKDTRPGAPAQMKLELSGHLARNTRVVLADVVRPDGSRTEVAAKIK